MIESYFNSAVGGPLEGSQFVLQSDSDWGQGLYALDEYVAANPNISSPLPVAYFGPIAPEFVSPRLVSLEPGFEGDKTFRTQHIAVSLTLLRGAPTVVRRPCYASPCVWPPHSFEDLSDKTPVAVVGGSIAVFRVVQSDDVETYSSVTDVDID